MGQPTKDEFEAEIARTVSKIIEVFQDTPLSWQDCAFVLGVSGRTLISLAEKFTEPVGSDEIKSGMLAGFERSEVVVMPLGPKTSH